MRPYRKAIEQNGEGDSVEDKAPIVKVDAANRVAKEQPPKGGLGASSHDFSMGLPVKLVVNEDAKVTHQRQLTDLKTPAARDPQVNRWPEGTDKFRVSPTRLECYEFRFIGVKAEAVTEKPIRDDVEAISAFLGNRLVCGAGGDNRAVIVASSTHAPQSQLQTRNFNTT